MLCVLRSGLFTYNICAPSLCLRSRVGLGEKKSCMGRVLFSICYHLRGKNVFWGFGGGFFG